MSRMLAIALVCASGVLCAEDPFECEYGYECNDADLMLREPDEVELDQGVEGEIGVVQGMAEWAMLYPPLAISSSGLTVGQADFEKQSPHHHQIGYGSIDATAHFGIHFPSGDVLAGEGGIGWTHLNWHDNPFFHETNWHTGRGGLLYCNGRLCDWLFRIGGSVSVDTEANSWGHGAQYGWLIWGRYQYNSDWNIHLGVMGLDGMHRQHSWPILGFEVDLSPNWHLALVYPIDVSLSYKWCGLGAMGINFRPVLSIHRAGEDEPVPNAIWQYKNLGAELFVRKIWRHLYVRVGTGLMFGDDIKVFDSDGHELRLYKFNSSGYAQGQVGFIF